MNKLHYMYWRDMYWRDVLARDRGLHSKAKVALARRNSLRKPDVLHKRDGPAPRHRIQAATLAAAAAGHCLVTIEDQNGSHFLMTDRWSRSLFIIRPTV